MPELGARLVGIAAGDIKLYARFYVNSGARLTDVYDRYETRLIRWARDNSTGGVNDAGRLARPFGGRT